MRRPFEHHQIDGIAQSTCQSKQIAKQSIGRPLLGVLCHNHGSRSCESQQNTCNLAPRWARMPEHNIYKNDKHRRQGHDNRHIDRIGIAQREVEKKNKCEQPQSAAQQYPREVGPGYFIGMNKCRCYPEQHTAAAEAKHRDIERTHPLWNKKFHHRYIHTEKDCSQ